MMKGIRMNLMKIFDSMSDENAGVRPMLQSEDDAGFTNTSDSTLVLESPTRVLFGKQDLTLAENKIQELEGTILDLMKYKDKTVELEENIKKLKKQYDLLSEHQGNLLKVLGKCEISATSKIKHLHSSSIKSSEEIIDLKKQITSLNQQRLNDIQEIESLKKLNEENLIWFSTLSQVLLFNIISLNQQRLNQIQEIENLKKINEENLTLISTLSQFEKKENSCPSSKGNKQKRALRRRNKSDSGRLKKKKSDSQDNIDQENMENCVPVQKVMPSGNTKRRRFAETIDVAPTRRKTRGCR